MMEEGLLKVLVESQLPSEWWDYAIFWEASSSPTTGLFSLSWKQGHFQGHAIDEDDPVSDTEWFYVASFGKSFALCEGVVGRTFTTGALVWLSGPSALCLYSCDRPRTAHSHGLQTFVCIPAPSHGVVELGSTRLINERSTLVQQTHSLLTQNPKPQPHSHVEAERRRRDKMNALFCELRSVVPKVTSSMDKASILDAAVSYIKELQARVAELEARPLTRPAEVKVEVKLMECWRESSGEQHRAKIQLASVRVQSAAGVRFPAARVMVAMRDLTLDVCHATISVINGVMLQDLVITVPHHLRTHTLLRTAIVASI